MGSTLNIIFNNIEHMPINTEDIVIKYWRETDETERECGAERREFKWFPLDEVKLADGTLLAMAIDEYGQAFYPPRFIYMFNEFKG